MSGARLDRLTPRRDRVSAAARRARVSAAGLRHRVLPRRLLTLTQLVLPAGDRALHCALRAGSAPVAPSRNEATSGIGRFGHVDLPMAPSDRHYAGARGWTSAAGRLRPVATA